MRWALRILLGLVVVVTLAAGGGWLYLRQSLPQVSGTLELSGLERPVEMIRDRHGIPHIFAQSSRDANFALGFAHAQDRLWQMEMHRRIAAGRLAELFGPSALDTDRFLRTLGIGRVAEATVRNLAPDTIETLEAYAAGVNAFLATRNGPLPPEFLIFGVEPEPWRPADSIGWVKMMAWDLATNWTQELLRLELAGRLDARQIAEFLPPYPGDGPVALADLGALYRGLDLDLNLDVERLLAAAAPLPEGAGSNNWVVAGSRSATGKPLLANDPHLGLSTPAIWYFAHLDAPDLQAIGATLPGVPTIILGRNQRIAWGFTNTGSDVQDLYIERIDPANPANYITPDGSRPFETRTETIKVKGAEDVRLDIRISRHGPIISDALGRAARATPAGHAMAFAWTALRDDDLTVQAGSRLPRAGNWEEFVEALREFHAPQQNIVYADVDGNIGFIAPARVPLRRPDNDLKGLAPAPGWDARYDWAGFIPFDELPQSYNPDSGHVVTANHKIVPDAYPHHLTAEWAEPYRARRIEQLLTGREAHSTESFMAIQADVFSPMVADLLPLLLAAPTASEAAADAMRRLRDWDRTMAANRPEPLIAVAWLREMMRLVYADELGSAFPVGWDMRPLFLHNVLSDRDGQSRWCDDVRTPDRTETCDAIAAQALEAALEDLRRRFGADMDRWRWGEAHPAVAEHRPFSRQRLLRRLFEIQVPTPGDTYSINVGRHRISDEAKPFANRHAASLRAIYDLADLDRSVFMHSTGQSGNRLSPHYDNFAEAWAAVEYLPMSTRRTDIEPGAMGRLELRPSEETAR